MEDVLIRNSDFYDFTYVLSCDNSNDFFYMEISHIPRKDMKFTLYIFYCVHSNWISEWKISPILHKKMVFLQYVFPCVDSNDMRKSCQILHEKKEFSYVMSKCYYEKDFLWFSPENGKSPVWTPMFFHSAFQISHKHHRKMSVCKYELQHVYSSHMYFQIAVIGGRFTTNLTRNCMESHIRFQVVFSREGCPSKLSREWLLPCMNSHM